MTLGEIADHLAPNVEDRSASANPGSRPRAGFA